MPVLPFIAGMGTAFGAIALARRRRPAPLPVAGYAPFCTVAVLLFTTAGWWGRTIDAYSSKLGFSHCAIDGCEVNAEGKAVLIDARPGDGVHRRLASYYEGREFARLLLNAADGAELYGCARAKVGAAYDPSSITCAALVYGCLPRHLQKTVDRHARGPGGLITPNQIARAFGALPGRDVLI